jgi:hypothetical protein
MMQLEGVTIFINSELIVELANRASLHDFAGVILLCLDQRLPREMSIQEFHEVAKQLRVLNLIPMGCLVEHIAIGCDRVGTAELIVNYTDGPR